MVYKRYPEFISPTLSFIPSDENACSKTTVVSHLLNGLTCPLLYTALKQAITDVLCGLSVRKENNGNKMFSHLCLLLRCRHQPQALGRGGVWPRMGVRGRQVRGCMSEEFLLFSPSCLNLVSIEREIIGF